MGYSLGLVPRPYVHIRVCRDYTLWNVHKLSSCLGHRLPRLSIIDSYGISVCVWGGFAKVSHKDG